MDPVGIKAATDEVAQVIVPQLRSMLNDALATGTASLQGVEKTIADTVPAYADGISQVLATLNRLDSRLDGAELDLDLKINGNIPITGTLKLRCPLPKGDLA